MRNTHLGGRPSVELNLALLRRVAAHIGKLREQVMFLGGAIVPLLVAEPVGADIRVAKDVDIMVHADSKADLWSFEDQLWDAGLKKMSTGATCHWRLGDVKVDVLTTEPDTVDFNNRWGREAMQRRQQRDLGDGLVVNLVRSTHYLAVKIDAFHRRGAGSHRTSVDVYDILLVLRGCPDLESDFRQHTSVALQTHLAGELNEIVKSGIEWQTQPADGNRFDAFARHWKPDVVHCVQRLAAATAG